MNVIIENLTDKPLWAQLNSGASVHIGPRSRSASIPDNEVKGNPKLASLSVRRHPEVEVAATVLRSR